MAGHFLGVSLLLSIMMYFLVGRVLGKRRQGLFGPSVNGEDVLEFGYCFDVRRNPRPHDMFRLTASQVSIRAFLPVWVFLYVLQFLLMPLIAQDYWVSNLFGTYERLITFSIGVLMTFRQYHVPFGSELLLRNRIPGI